MKVAIIVIAIIAIVVVIALICFLIFKNKKKTKRIKIDEDFINNLLTYLGEASNLESVNTENGRLIIKVKDLDIVNLEGIKSLSSGVFITGNSIKTLFRLDSQLICSALEERIK
ncbi:MAG: hypothetical protein K6E20_00730 [Acholeplasmatales bacterium]|nr:hypothetical protein [Acholeplasmatales bacterium]